MCFVFSRFADMFLQHLNTELDEEDVQKITSGSKAKTQIMVLTVLLTLLLNNLHI